MKIEDINSFKKIDMQISITAGGQIVSGETSINYSSILTKLIQEAGRWCKAYASDLFILWNTVIKTLESGQAEDASYLFGFYENGVDNAQSIINQYQSIGYMAGLRYRAIWRLDVTVNEETRLLEMTLYEVYR